MGDLGHLLWPPAWCWVWFMTWEAQEGARVGLEVGAGPGHGRLWSFRAASVAGVPSGHLPLGPGDPAEGPPEHASPRHRGPASPQVPDVPHHEGGLQPARPGLPRPHLPPHPRARLLCPPRGGERPGRQSRWGGRGAPPLAWALAVGMALLRAGSLVHKVLRSAQMGLFASLSSAVFACVCVRACLLCAVGVWGRACPWCLWGMCLQCVCGVCILMASVLDIPSSPGTGAESLLGSCAAWSVRGVWRKVLWDAVCGAGRGCAHTSVGLMCMSVDFCGVCLACIV